MSLSAFPLAPRMVLVITGADRFSFLQGILTNDLEKVKNGNAIYALMLTPQGKYLFDCFVAPYQESIFIELHAARAVQFLKKLQMYTLRSQVTITDRSSEYTVYATLSSAGIPAQPDDLIYTDPRDARIGQRLILKNENVMSYNLKLEPQETYHAKRIALTIPETDLDLIAEDSFPLTSRMEELHAIDFQKGCYVGQEVTARSKHRGTLRKNLFTVQSDSSIPTTGNTIYSGDKKVGILRSISGNQAIAELPYDMINALLTLETSIPLRVLHPPVSV